MDHKRIIRLISLAAMEIQSLRRENQILGENSRVVDAFSAALAAEPRRVKMGEDVVRGLEEVAEELRSEEGQGG